MTTLYAGPTRARAHANHATVDDAARRHDTAAFESESLFTEIRDNAHQRTLAVAASATVGMCVTLVAAILVAVGAIQ